MASSRRNIKPVSIVFALLGIALFLYYMRRAGFETIFQNIRRLGFGLLLIIGISGIRSVVRALAWTLCVENNSGRLRFIDALKARIMGDAIGVLVFLPFSSMVVAEPAKAVFVRHRLPLVFGFASLAIENIFYSLSVVIFLLSGICLMLLSFSVPNALRYASIGALAGIGIVIPLGYFVLHKQWRFLSKALEFLYGKGIAKGALSKRRESVRELEERVYGFYAGNKLRFLPIMTLEFCFHMAGVLESLVALSFISPLHAPTLFTGFVLESANRVVSMVFKFIPLRTGVGEGVAGWLAVHMGFELGVGETLEITRKIRDLFWTGVGFFLIVHRGFTVHRITEETEAAVVETAASME